jgi:cobalt-zinc-cadmium efflux system membrane fusion protein
VELAIFEAGVPPEYRAWITRGGQPVSPGDVTLTVTLERLDGERNVFRFQPQGDFLRGDGTVTEPHSFDVTVEATHAGAAHRWTYESHEGRVQIAADSAAEAGIEVQAAGPATIHDVLALYGRVVVAPEAVRTVSARFPGVIRELRKTVGERVRAGEVLARVESNDSLRVYDVTAPIDGVISARRANPGEQAGEAPLLTVSDTRQLWAELAVFPRDLARVRIGQQVRLTGAAGDPRGSARITRIAPLGGENQSLTVWAAIDDPGTAWTPGLYVSAEVLTGGGEVPLAVRASALQRFRDFTVVFARVGDTYEVRMLELGRSDGEYVEVLGGLKPGTEYVTAQSYLIKADIEKSGASHDH